jgi:hypothetical protein
MRKNYNTELDYVLEKLIKAYENNWKAIKDAFGTDEEKTIGEISRELKEKFKVEDWELTIIYEYLKNDEYIKGIDPLSITLKGVTFSLSGGYTANKQREEDSKFYKLLRSWSIAIGTTLAGLYALCQFFEMIYKNCSCH